MASLLILFCPLSVDAQIESQPQEGSEPFLGKRSAIQPEDDSAGWVRVEAGAEIHEQPNPASTVLDIVAEPTDFEVLDARGEWIRVLHGGWIGWIAVGSGEQKSRQIPIQYTPDDERLLRARSILREGIEATTLGPFELYSDVEDTELLARFAQVASHLSDSYRERYGLDPGDEASEVVVIFDSYDDYLRFESGEPEIAGTGTRGYTGRGITVLSIGDRSTEAATEILVHELTHVLNRRVFGMNSPAWVEEGLADDLAYSRVGADGRLILGTLGGLSHRDLSTDVSGRFRVDIEISGGKAMLSNLLNRWSDPDRPSLEELLDMQWIDFIQPDVRPLHYAESAFFVRFLLSSKDGTTRQGLLSYLQALAVASIPQGETLWAYLGDEPKKVESAYYRWLRRFARANGL